MLQNKHIIKYIAGLILYVLVIMFLHSETTIFDCHSEECSKVDFCLIMGKASFDNHIDTNKSIKVFQPCILDINFILNADLIPLKKFQITVPIKTLLKTQSFNLVNCNLRI